MSFVDFTISVLAIFTQLYVIWIGLKVLKVAKFLNTWRIGWYHFVMVSVFIILGHLLLLYEIYNCDTTHSNIRSIFTLFVTVGLLWFVYYMREVFKVVSKTKSDEGGIKYNRRSTDIVEHVRYNRRSTDKDNNT